MPRTQRHANSPIHWTDDQLTTAYNDTLHQDNDTLHRNVCTNAACAQTDPEIFYPDHETAKHTSPRYDPIQICQTCPTQTDCLILALRSHQITYGIWGGTLAHHRRQIHARLARTLGHQP
jgi:WhiB family redox-sensing transcriptional regulator